MKKLYSLLSALAFFTCFTSSLALSSCSNDTTLSVNDTSSVFTENQNELTHRAGDIMPANSDNPYDSAGRIHNELLETYYASENLPQSISAIANRVLFIANEHSEFEGMKSSSYHTVSAERIQYIISHSDTIVSEIVNGLEMTLQAKLSLESFINSMLLLADKEDSCEGQYEYVVAYETDILINPLFTERDKQIILTTTSITRHSTYRVNKRPKKNTDPDWGIFVGRIIGAAEGSAYDSATAITMALATGIAQNP